MSSQVTPAELLAARTALGVSIKTAAAEMGIGFTKILNFNRGRYTTPETLATIAEWVSRAPVDIEERADEVWLPVVGWEALYEVSNQGRVRSVQRSVAHQYSGEVIVRARELRQSLDGFHLQVTLGRNGKGYSRRVHLLVLEAFVGARPPGFDGCHNNGIVTDNVVTNLRWDTRTENMLDRFWHEKNPGVVRPEVAARLASGDQS